MMFDDFISKKAGKRAARLFAALVLIGSTACQTAKRAPSSEAGSKGNVAETESWVEAAVGIASSERLANGSCVSIVESFLGELASLDPALLNWDDRHRAATKERASSWLRGLFEARLKIRARIPELVRSEGKPCLQAIRRYLVYVRFAEEMLVESMVYHRFYDRQDADGEESAFRGPFPATLINPKFAKLEIKAGDVILDRGAASLSAMIARISPVENVYSHALIIGEDKNGKLYAVEASATSRQTINIMPVQDYWNAYPDARMAVFRQPDEMLAHRAARFIYDYADKHKSSIHYDFHMNDDDPKELFCSEVPQLAYRRASSPGKFEMPMFKTDLNRFKAMGAANWVRAMGIDRDQIFAPSDLDVDPRFDLVAEYRFVPSLRSRRIDDAVMSSIYSWMIDKHYKFNNNAQDVAGAQVALMRMKMSGEGDFSPNITPGALRATIEFRRVFGIIRANLDAAERAYYDSKGQPMSFAMMMKINEEFRRSDCRASRAPGGNKLGVEESFHRTLSTDAACE